MLMLTDNLQKQFRIIEKLDDVRGTCLEFNVWCPSALVPEHKALLMTNRNTLYIIELRFGIGS